MRYISLIYFLFISFNTLAQKDEEILESKETSYPHVEKLIFYQKQYLFVDLQRGKDLY